MRRAAIAVMGLLILVAGCASTEFKTYETQNGVREGTGGAKEVVDGMEVWSKGEPPRKYEIIGIIEDERPRGAISMAALEADIVQTARDNDGDAVIAMDSESELRGFVDVGSGVTSMAGRNHSNFAVIRYID